MNRRLLTMLAMFALALPAFTSAGASIPEPQIVAVKFHGDWCGSCRKMGNVFTDLQNKLDGSPVLFVQLDLTNTTTRHQAVLMASALGLSNAYTENPGTGFILLVDARSKKVIKKLTADMTFKQMAAEITTLLTA